MPMRVRVTGRTCSPLSSLTLTSMLTPTSASLPTSAKPGRQASASAWFVGSGGGGRPSARTRAEKVVR